MEGDEDGAAQVLLKLTGRIINPTQSSPDMTGVVLAVKQQLLNDSALDTFNADFQDIVKDPYLEGMTADRIQALMDAGTPFAEALPLAAKSTRDWLHAQAGIQTNQSPTTPPSTKLERKQAITSIPAVSVRSMSPANDVELSSGDSIAEMNRSRGQGR